MLGVARALIVFPKRPGGQSQFSLHLLSQATSHSGIRQAQDWVLSAPAREHTVAELASKAAMSERNFRRVFAEEVGVSPMTFVEQVRVDAARRFLEEGDLPLKTVAQKVGFSSDEQLRRSFMRRVGVTPREYRQRFATALDEA